LVKDGATAIAALGQDIDTALVDLKGGTTGQVLAKASGTDLDYTWTTPEIGDITAVTAGTGISGGGTTGAVTITNSMATAIDDKGDLIAGTGADTFAKLAVGNNGETLIADSSTSTGLRYGANFASGKNGILNSNFNIFQRGTTATSTTDGYQADRWYNLKSAINITVSQQASTLQNIPNCARFQRVAGQTGTGATALAQMFENAQSITYANQIITISFWARKGADYSTTSSLLGWRLITGTGTDTRNVFTQGYTSQATTGTGSVTLTTSWQRFSVNVTIPSTTTQMSFYFTTSFVGTAGAADYYEVTGVQLETGSVATAFQTATGNLGSELASCQRYLPAIAASNGELFTGQAYSATAALIPVIFPVTARVAPTGITVNSAGNFRLRSSTASKLTTTAINFSTGTVQGCTIEGIVSTGLTAGNATNLFNESAGTILFTGCEI
jgi:hypothetical protein